MKKSIYLLLILIVVLATAIACKSKPTQLSSFTTETGLIDEATGKVWTNGFIETDTVTATEETLRGYTNLAPVKEIITQYVKGETQYIIKYVTNETVAQLPDKPGAKYRISVLWTESSEARGIFVDVDYRDTARLNRLWLEQINREGAKDGKVFAIRNGRNPYGIEDFQKSLPAKDENEDLQDYYYFDSKGNIYYKPDNRLIKKFVGAIIVPRIYVTKKNYGFADSVTHEYGVSKEYTVGALYKMAISGDEANSIYGRGGSARNAVHTFIEADITLSKFWNGAYYENIFFQRQFPAGALEVLVMNPDGNEGIKGAAGIDSYYVWWEGNDRNEDKYNKMLNEKLYLAERPEFTFPQFTRYVVFSDSGNTPWWCFMFMPGHKN
ncbi:unknown [Brachyspira sp. CAG:700]|nr:unknown [Brachyspira sp. CAG:700]